MTGARLGPGRGHVRLLTLSQRATRGMLAAGPLRLPCAIGRAGIRVGKREGDGATPFGSWSLQGVRYRRDKALPPRTGLPVSPIARQDGWCDAPADRNYNRPVRHPYPASAERMWRDDGLYDLVVMLDCNVRPRVRGKGSAIFMHIARDGFAPTEGCVALRRADLRKVLRLVQRGSRLRIGGGNRPKT